MRKVCIITVLACIRLWAMTGEEVIKKYGLTDLSFDKSTFTDSLCPVLAESTYTWYNESNGLVDSQYNYTESDKENCCYWKIYFNHKVFPNGVRATREHRVDANSSDTASKTLSKFSPEGNLLESDDIFLRFNSRMISSYTYNERGQRTAYFHINVGTKGTLDTGHTELTTYEKNGCPRELLYPKKDAKAIYECSDFDSAVALIQIENGEERPHWVKLYDKNKRLLKRNEYSWNRDGNPLMRIIFYDYDSKGRVKREYYMMSPDCMSRPYSGPGSFEINRFAEYRYDSKGRIVTFTMRKQRCFGK